MCAHVTPLPPSLLCRVQRRLRLALPWSANRVLRRHWPAVTKVALPPSWQFWNKETATSLNAGGRPPPETCMATPAINGPARQFGALGPGLAGLTLALPTTGLIAFGFPMCGLCLWLTVNLSSPARQQSPPCGIPVVPQACMTHMLISRWPAHLKCHYRTTCHACDAC